MRGKGALFCRDLLLADPSPSMPSSASLWVCGMGSEQWDGVLQPLPITCAAPNHFSLSFWAFATHLTVSQLGCPHGLELGPQLAPSHRPPCSVWGCWGQYGAPMLACQGLPCCLRVLCQTAWGGQLPSLPKVSAFCSGTITPPNFYFSWFKSKILVSLQGRENSLSGTKCN